MVGYPHKEYQNGRAWAHLKREMFTVMACVTPRRVCVYFIMFMTDFSELGVLLQPVAILFATVEERMGCFM